MNIVKMIKMSVVLWLIIIKIDIDFFRKKLYNLTGSKISGAAAGIFKNRCKSFARIRKECDIQ